MKATEKSRIGRTDLFVTKLGLGGAPFGGLHEDVQRQIRTIPKPVIAMVAGYAVGGGHVLHMMCDITIAADNSQFGQTGTKVGAFDGGWGASYMARIIGQKRAREMWFTCRFYNAKKAAESCRG